MKTRRLHLRQTLSVAAVVFRHVVALAAVDPIWQNLSSKRGGLPAPPGGSAQQTGAVVADFDGDGDLDLLNKPYNWDTPRVDVWLNNGGRAGAKGAGTSASFHGPVGVKHFFIADESPTVLDQVPHSLRYLESLAW